MTLFSTAAVVSSLAVRAAGPGCTQAGIPAGSRTQPSARGSVRGVGAGTPSRPAPAHYPSDVAIQVDTGATGPADALRAGQAGGGRLLTARGRRTRATLVTAAKAVFAETPFADTRIADITARASVANGTFYTYFDSKEEIFREVAAGVLDAMLRAPVRDPDATQRDPIRDIEYASRAYFQVVVDNAVVARSIEQLVPVDAAVAGERRSTIIGAIKRADSWIRRLQARGVCDDVDSWTTAIALQTMTIRVAYDHLLPHAGEVDVDVDAMARTVSRIWARTVGLERVTTPGAT